MAYEYRRPVFNLSGTLTSAIAATDTQISSTAFVNLATDYSTSIYTPLVIANDAQGKAEVVWVTGHSSAAGSVTVVRGREGTSAQAFSVGDVVRCAPTIRDVVPSYPTVASLPTDAHYGMRATVSGIGNHTYDQTNGWLQSRRLVCVVNNGADFTYSSGSSDLFAQTGWVRDYDPQLCAVLSTAVGTYSYIQIPETRRYDVVFTAGIAGATVGASLSVKVTRNGMNVTANPIASDTRSVANAGENWPRAERLAVSLTAGDKLYWSTWGSANHTVKSVLFNVPTQIMLRTAE